MMNKICLLLMLGVTSCTPKESKVEPYQPYKPFAIVVEETEWHGKLEPGRYTKNGIKILEKHER
jgi:hypothetical protein